MKKTAILILAATGVASAQVQTAAPVQTKATAIAGAGTMVQSDPVKGAPYSATLVNESVQTLLDGNRIVQNSGGSVARDSQGRTRQSMPLPTIANLSADNAPQ